MTSVLFVSCGEEFKALFHAISVVSVTRIVFCVSTDQEWNTANHRVSVRVALKLSSSVPFQLNGTNVPWREKPSYRQNGNSCVTFRLRF